MNDKKTSSSLINQPIRDGAWVYMWIAHYSDGTSLPQYDPYTLETNTFKKVNQDKLVKFGLYPFPSNLAKRIMEKKNILIRSNPLLPTYEVEIDGNKRVIGALTTNFDKKTSFVTCPKCNTTLEAKNFKLVNIGNQIKTYICPSCGERGYWTCPECGKKYEHVNKSDDWKCVDCGSKINARGRPEFEVSVVQERWRIYKLGWQETVNGINKKVIMHIQENGNCELKDK